jgi:hypothetical protein
MAGVASNTAIHRKASRVWPHWNRKCRPPGQYQIVIPVLSEVEPYALRGARTVPGGEPAARRVPTRLATR